MIENWTLTDDDSYLRKFPLTNETHTVRKLLATRDDWQWLVHRHERMIGHGYAPSHELAIAALNRFIDSNYWWNNLPDHWLKLRLGDSGPLVRSDTIRLALDGTYILAIRTTTRGRPTDVPVCFTKPETAMWYADAIDDADTYLDTHAPDRRILDARAEAFVAASAAVRAYHEEGVAEALAAFKRNLSRNMSELRHPLLERSASDLIINGTPYNLGPRFADLKPMSKVKTRREAIAGVTKTIGTFAEDYDVGACLELGQALAWHVSLDEAYAVSKIFAAFAAELLNRLEAADYDKKVRKPWVKLNKALGNVYK